MKKLNYEKGLTIFVSDEIWRKYATHRKGKKLVGLDINSHLDKCPPDLKKDIQIFSKKTGLSGITILYAHGTEQTNCFPSCLQTSDGFFFF